MKTKLYIAVLITLSNFAFSQSKLEKAKQYKDNYDYSKAIALYEEVSKKRNIQKPEIIRDIAQSYIMLNDMESAQQWLDKINGLMVYSPKDLLNYAFTLKTTADYDMAISVFKKYEELFPHLSAKVPEWIESCKMAEDWMNNPKLFNIQNLSNVNTEYSDFGATGFEDGILFVSDRKEDNKSYKADEIFGWTGNPYLRV
ncbi:MAG: tetratricopeptide repeat protein, partial [Ignavibacteria bacterium]|nr:tetratricopeptide repeat protein [Ignavibacteria bacterium]